MSGMGDGSARDDADYHSARNAALDADHSVEGNQAWKTAQDEMARLEREAEWRRRDEQRDAASAAGQASGWAGHEDSGGSRGSGAAWGSGTGSPPGTRVSFAIADSLANSVAGMTRTHPGVFQWFFRLCARFMTLPIPYLQRELSRRGVTNPMVRVPVLFAGWIAYLAVIDLILIVSSRR